jgi:hypothetical protein
LADFDWPYDHFVPHFVDALLLLLAFAETKTKIVQSNFGLQLTKKR